jgi:hypothetical protein
MEMIERYLQAVRFWLPNRQKDDIIAELSADIYAQVEEREAGLGRKLTDAEIEALLKQRGRPVFVANRFLPQEQLIGPLLFPVYRFVIKVIALCYLVPWVLVWIGMITFDSAYRAEQTRSSWFAAVGSMASSLWTTAFIAIGTATLVFAVLERIQARSHFLEDWSPRKLPPARDPNLIPRSGSSFEMAVNWIFFFWWVAYLHSPQVNIGSSVHITLSPMWAIFYWGYFVLALGNATLAAANLMQPHWSATRATLRMLSDGAGAALFCWLLKANILTGIAVANVLPEKTTALTSAINQWAPKAFPVAVLVGAIVVAVDIYRIVRVHAPTEPISL